MYLRTPKRYTRGHRRSIISLRWLWLWVLTPLIVYGGIRVYQDRETITPRVSEALNGVINQAQESVATAMAPTPLPTENPTIRLNVANAAWQRGAIAEAVNIFNEVSGAVPNDVEIHYYRTLGLAMNGFTNEALSAAEETINADPYSPDAWAIRSMVLTWGGQAEMAIPSALRAIELAGDDPENTKAQARAQAFLAEAYLNVGQYERARTTVERALETDPDSFEALRVRSLVAQQYEFDFLTALRYSQTAYDLAPNLPYLTIDLVELELREGNTDIAQAMLDEVIENNPSNTRALWWMGYIYLNTLGDPNEGADYFGRCVEANPESILCLYNLGRAQMRLEQYASALESFETTIRLGTTSARHYWWAGRAQVVQNGCPAATNYLRTGYEMAKTEGDEILIGDFEDQMQSCQLFVPPSFEATEEATAEAVEEAAS